MYNGLVASIVDVAKRAGVSATTAKRAIRTPDKLAPATLKRVLEAIEDLHYEPDKLASALRSGHSKSIGLIVGNIVEPFFAHLTRVVGHEVRAREYTLLIADSEYDSENELSQLKEFHGNRIGGLIIRSSYGVSNVPYLKRMRDRGAAIVEIDYFYPGSPFSHVMLDNEASVRTGVEYLASLGHQRIAALGSYHETILPDERTRAFPKALAAVGLGLPEPYVKAIYPTRQAAYELTKSLLGLPEPPTALFSTTGNLALGAFHAIRELELTIPDDVSLLSFDDYPWTSVVEPPIDVIEQPVEAMGRAAVETVFELLESDLKRVKLERFQSRLIRRGSCAPPKP